MSKLVVLKLGKGSFEQGFPVTLQIGEEGASPYLELNGELPPDHEIPQLYSQWQDCYRQLKLPGRPIGLPKVPKTAASVEDCNRAAAQLHDRCNTWLDAPSFRKLRETWLEQLAPTDTIRVVVQTNDPQLRRLPWHLWDLMARYPQAEIALSPLDFGSRPRRPATPSGTVRILAILGNSHGIDVQTDRQVLEQLTDATVTFLVEPDRQDLNDQLWEQNWDILFFAGHSMTQGADEAGLIHLNQTETLTISQLKHALEKAVERGLKLAIFNSCDGLGLARELADLHIPQLIVMREPVPDRVAQEFLKYFLADYSQGNPLYLAVRTARQRLQGLEGQFPCATWLPVICQHPAEIPPTWDGLKGGSPAVKQPEIKKTKGQRGRRKDSESRRAAVRLPWVMLSSVTVTGLILGVRYLGGLQPVELKALDHLMQMRPKEPADSRLLVVEVTEKDVQAQQQQDPKQVPERSLSDRSLAILLEKLEALQPRVIGLDIYRDFPASKEFPKLATRLKTSDRLITVCLSNDANPDAAADGIKPPPELPATEVFAAVGFSNIMQDEDDLVRRQLLSMPTSSACPTEYALSMQIALQYLAAQGIHLQFTADGNWQLGNALIHPIAFPIGGYFKIDGRGKQILLNYRSPINDSSFQTPEDIAPRISLGEALAGGLTADRVKDRIVLIGTTARRFKDYLPTPYHTEQGTTQEIPGVMLQAQLVSQIVSTVLDGRPLLWAWSLWAESLWIGGWSLLGGLFAWYVRRFAMLTVASAGAIALLYVSCLLLLMQFGCWAPLIPSALAYLGSAGIALLSGIWLTRHSTLSTAPLE